MMEYIAIENHPNDSRVKLSGDIFQTLSSRMETGGGNVPMVMEMDGDDDLLIGVGIKDEIAGTMDASYYKGPGARGV